MISLMLTLGSAKIRNTAAIAQTPTVNQRKVFGANIELLSTNEVFLFLIMI